MQVHCNSDNPSTFSYQNFPKSIKGAGPGPFVNAIHHFHGFCPHGVSGLFCHCVQSYRWKVFKIRVFLQPSMYPNKHLIKSSGLYLIFINTKFHDLLKSKCCEKIGKNSLSLFNLSTRRILL